MYNIAVMGDHDSIYGFAAIGIDTYPVTNADEGGKLLKKLSSGKYAIIYITEALAKMLDEEIEIYKEKSLPAIILIPGITGNTGKGMQSVKRSVEQAVGSDIIFNN